MARDLEKVVQEVELQLVREKEPTITAAPDSGNLRHRHGNHLHSHHGRH
jgi:hypothetical protein